jgi:GNAT superfamily N-acetyltransferase
MTPDAAPSSVHIRRIRADEGLVLRAVRLRALTETPEAFGQTVDDAASRPDAEWHHAARVSSDGDRRAWFFAVGAHGQGADRTGGVDRTVGVVLGRRRPPDVAMVFSMWVDPGVRRHGVGRRLIEAVEQWALGWGATSTVLWVFGTNEPAIRFYERLGFLILRSGEDAETGAQYGALAMARAIQVDVRGGA